MQSTENQRHKIICIAAEKMKAVGVRSVSIDDICSEIGMSKKTFYVYFESKDALVEALLAQNLSDMQKVVEVSTKNKDSVELILNFFRLQQKVNDVRQIPTLVYDLQKYYPLLMKQHSENVRQFVEQLSQRMLEKGRQEGIFREDLKVDVAARLLAALHQIWCKQVLAHSDQPTIIADSKYAFEIFFRGLISDKGKQQILQRIK